MRQHNGGFISNSLHPRIFCVFTFTSKDNLSFSLYVSIFLYISDADALGYIFAWFTHVPYFEHINIYHTNKNVGTLLYLFYSMKLFEFTRITYRIQ